MKRALLAGIRFYQKSVSPLRPPACRGHDVDVAFVRKGNVLSVRRNGVLAQPARGFLRGEGWHDKSGQQGEEKKTFHIIVTILLRFWLGKDTKNIVWPEMLAGLQ